SSQSWRQAGSQSVRRRCDLVPAKTLIHLSQAALPHLDLPTPDYDRAALSVGIVHIGVGGFHRAHQAMYLDSLMNRGQALDWAICGLGVLPGDARMRDALKVHDCFYTLAFKHLYCKYAARYIGSI